jgi:hypothetical protein
MAERARSCSGEGFDAAGRGRATGASTVTGGRLDCCASAPENDATAIKPATAETFRPELLSGFSFAELFVADARNDFGILALLINPIPKIQLQLIHAFALRVESLGIDREIFGQRDLMKLQR